MPDRIYERNELIHNRYVVQQMLGAGNFSYVYKVLDTLSGDVVALKIFKEGTGVLEQLRDEFHILKLLDHPHIAKVFDIGQINDSGNSYYYLKLEFIDGNLLSNVLQQGRISLRKAREITTDLLNAVGYLHGRRVMHRDIKPNNIITNGRGTVIVDFNISKIVENYATSRVGTPRYTPPEVNIQGWNWTGDLYAIGLVLYEMVTSHYPFADNTPPLIADPKDPRDFNATISQSLASVILKSLAREPQNRYQSAQEMLDALNCAEWEPVWQPYRMSDMDLANIQIPIDEQNRANYNPYLSRLLMLYSQSHQSNSGTRGLDDFARVTYVATKLDKELKPTILGGAYSLVIITGNAGDGKTAFIQKLEEEVRKSPLLVKFEPLASGNGAHFVYNGREYFTNYDGSQDEGQTNNDIVLENFFKPYGGDKPLSSSTQTRIIAINEGRLEDFLQTQRDLFPYLYQQVRDFFERGYSPDKQLLIVNLNLRAVIADDENGASIFDQMIDRLTAPAFWEPCKTCDIANRCYAKFNADSMNDPNYGPQIRLRLKALFQVAHFRQRLHITIRDLRSALAYILFSIDDCEGIREILNNRARLSEYIGRFFYNAPYDFEQPGRVSNDRLVRLLSEIDPGQVANPKLDAHIAFVPTSEITILPPFDRRGDYDRSLLQIQYDAIQEHQPGMESGANLGELSQLSQSRFYHAVLRRKVFFERIDDKWGEMLPYTRFEEYLSILSQPNEKYLESTKNGLVRAISLSEGIHDSEIGSEFLCLSTTQETKATIKSFRRFHADRFKCSIKSIESLSKYIEYIPAVLILKYLPSENMKMEISLDLFEMLHRIQNGYTPSLNELRGSFINILIFKRQLASTHYDEVLLTETGEKYYRVYKTTDKKLILEEG
jgi:predicted Ser/Thr protein kinase